MNDVRIAAVTILTAIERGQTTLSDELERARAGVSGKDRGLLFEIAAGTLRWRAALDVMIGALSRRPIAQLDPAVRALLRLGAYQLTHLDRVPAHAVVNESVSAVRRLKFSSAAGFVNAVLRGIGRGDGARALPPRPDSPANRAAWLEYLSTTLSHPRWLVERWVDRYGVEATERWCRFNNASPHVTLRLSPGIDRDDFASRVSTAGIRVEPAAHVATAVHVAPGGVSRLPAEVWQRAVIQDEGSQLVGLAAASAAGTRVLDVCAAPGGKTAILAGVAGPAAVVAADYRPARVALLRATLQRAGLDVSLVRLDARQPLPFTAAFDTVLLDAPCSGLGTLRRDPDLKWSRQAGDLDTLAAGELSMLEHASRVVRPGGAVVYATCSSEPEENELVVDRFLEANPQFELTPVKFPPTVTNADELLDARGRMRTLPFRDGLDAFFAALLRRA